MGSRVPRAFEFAVSRFRGFAPPLSKYSSATSESAQEVAQTALMGSFGANFEAVPRPAQFKLRAPESMLAFSAGQIVDWGGLQH
eukprot:14439017-Alexandrium_andersonii.AAC.1